MSIFSRILFPLLCAAVLSSASFAETTKTQVDSTRVYRLDCGAIHFQDLAIFSDTGEYDGKPITLTDTCILVGHPKGWLLWDAGLPKSLIGAPQKDETLGLEMTLKVSLTEQLEGIGLTPQDITYLSFSHSHFDHTGQANDFASATWIWQEKELAHALSTPTPFGVNPDTFSATETAKKVMINGDYDVFGDGKVRLLAAPGHTPGHQVLMVTLEHNTWIFSGDLYHQEESREKGLIPVFNDSRADTEASMHRIERLLKNYKATLVVQHEMKDVEKMPPLPRYLQ